MCKNQSHLLFFITICFLCLSCLYSKTEEEGTFDNIKLKRSLINFLLINDIPEYKNYSNNIYKARNIEIENLFNGNFSFDYTSFNLNENNAQNLLLKFISLNVLLKNWYKDVLKHNYILQIWVSNPDLEELKKLDENKRKQILHFIKEWPIEIQNELNQIIDNYDNEYLRKMKENLQKEEELIKMLDTLKATIDIYMQENTNNKVKENFEKSYKLLFKKIIFKAVLNITYTKLCKGRENCKKIIELLEKLNVKLVKNIYENGFNSRTTKEIKNYFINLIKGGFEDKLESIIIRFIKSKIFKAEAYLIKSVFNFVRSCSELYNTFNEINKIEGYNKKLEELEKKFEIDSDLELTDEDDYDTMKEKISIKTKEIVKNLEDLKELKSEIESSIDVLKDQEDKSVTGIIAGGLGILTAMFGGIFTGGLTTLFFMSGSILNAISALINAVDADVSEKRIEELIKIKDRLEKTKEKWEKKLDKLIKEAKNKIFNKKNNKKFQ